MGHSRGGLTSKIHALVETASRPVRLRLMACQVTDCTEVKARADALNAGDVLLADKGYGSDTIRVQAKQ